MLHHGNALSSHRAGAMSAAMVDLLRTSCPHPAAPQVACAASVREWLPSNPWRLCPGPSIVSVRSL